MSYTFFDDTGIISSQLKQLALNSSDSSSNSDFDDDDDDNDNRSHSTKSLKSAPSSSHSLSSHYGVDVASSDRQKDKSLRATVDQVLDARSMRTLRSMMRNNIIDRLYGCISTGKEANVYHALTSDNQHLAIKIYKTSILQFKNREKYVNGEYRFRNYIKNNSAKMVRQWSEKEMRNLRRLYSSGIHCPEPIIVRKSVLVMTLIHEDDDEDNNNNCLASPRLKDAISPATCSKHLATSIFKQILQEVRTLYCKCNLVHADLSEYNILLRNHAVPYIIDVSQSVEANHKLSYEFLRSDLLNLTKFFARFDVPTLPLNELFAYVTGATKDKLTMNLDELFNNAELRSSDDVDQENAVFLKSFIPQNLNQVFDIERDTLKVIEGKQEELVYGSLLADSKRPQSTEMEVENECNPNDFDDDRDDDLDDNDDSNDEDDVDSNDDDDDDDDDNEDNNSKIDIDKTQSSRLLYRFRDKDEKKRHKQLVKEERKIARQNKMPKSQKKKLLKKTSRNKKK